MPIPRPPNHPNSYAHGSSRGASASASAGPVTTTANSSSIEFDNGLKYEDMEALLLDLDIIPRLLGAPAVRRLCAQVK